MVDGFFRTGDVAVMDEDGCFYLVDRIKDLIICSGYNVYPRRIRKPFISILQSRRSALSASRTSGVARPLRRSSS